MSGSKSTASGVSVIAVPTPPATRTATFALSVASLPSQLATRPKSVRQGSVMNPERVTVPVRPAPSKAAERRNLPR